MSSFFIPSGPKTPGSKNLQSLTITENSNINNLITKTFTVDTITVNSLTATSISSLLITDGIATLQGGYLTGLNNPIVPSGAATKEYVDNVLETRAILLSLDLSDGQTNIYIINNILNVMAPPGADYRDQTYCRILCSIANNSTTTLDINPLISQSTATFVTPGPGTASAVTNVAIGIATVSAAPISLLRFIKTFQIQVGSWTHISDTATF